MAATVTTTLTIEVASEFAEFIQKRVASGRSEDAAAVVEEALWLLDNQDRLEWMRARVAEGLEEIERGETIPYTPELFGEMKRTAEENHRRGVPIDDAVIP